MYIKIRKRSKNEWLLLYIAFLPFLFYVLMDILRFPQAIKYTIDVAWLVLLLETIAIKSRLHNPQLVILLRIVIALFAFSLVGFLLEFQSVFYYLWGIRNNLRFFVYFFACAIFLNLQGAEAILRIMDKVFWLNFFLTLFQFFVLGMRQDYLGGIFGVEKGCNAYTNIFLMIVVSDQVLRYMNGKGNLRNCLYRCMGALLIAAFAELKVFYFEFVLIVVLASLMTKFSSRKLWITLGGFVGLIVALRILEQLFPHFKGWFKLANMWETISATSGYTNSNDMNRITSIFISWNEMLDSGLRKLFGLGLGNCDYASGYDFLTTPFYMRYRLMHYMWFSSSFMLLETGVVGTVLYICFFVAVYFKAKQRQYQNQKISGYCQMARIMAVMCMILFIYNSSLRTEAGYMVYLVLALPFIRVEDGSNKDQLDKSREYIK